VARVVERGALGDAYLARPHTFAQLPRLIAPPVSLVHNSRAWRHGAFGGSSGPRCTRSWAGSSSDGRRRGDDREPFRLTLMATVDSCGVAGPTPSLGLRLQQGTTGMLRALAAGMTYAAGTMPLWMRGR
jgi:hypothetical protein